MSLPTVVAVCLTADRPEMTRQAVESFRAQTYPREKRLLFVMDTGTYTKWSFDLWGEDNEGYFNGHPHRGKTVGELRNLANQCHASDIICHFDSDDWSHPNRIAEQVSLLQRSGSECVGFNEMLFWRDGIYCTCEAGKFGSHHYCGCAALDNKQAWLYTNRSATWALGTSLCYWRSAWERAPFAALNSGEDTDWFNRVKVHAVSGATIKTRGIEIMAAAPAMVARIHAGNAGNSAYWPAEMAKAPHHWRRVPTFDDYCREVFEK